MTDHKKYVPADYLSFTTQQISIGFTKTDIIFSTASSFVYNLNDKYYLITNWHNVTGQNPVTGEHISDTHAGIPDIFLTYLRLKDGGGRGRLEKILLYEDDEMTKPVWFVHPNYKQKVDVVAIELKADDDLVLSAINRTDFDNDIPPDVGDDCFVIGYPFSSFRDFGMPIWKRASIATEPRLDEDQLPKLLIDTATRPGLSGSPVIFQRVGVHNMINGKLTDKSSIGRIRNFLGVYSGRIGKGEIHAQLGIVWKAHLIEEIINGQTKGNIEFQFGNKKNGY